MKHLFIINPVAGKGKALEFIPKIEKLFSSRKNDVYFIETTERPGHATELVRNYVSRDTYRVYSLGGDGTLNEVLNGLAGSDSSLAVIPTGSGNDFVKSLENYSLFDIHHTSQKEVANSTLKEDLRISLLKSLVDGEERPVDIGKVNDRYFINISSMGFDAIVVHKTNTLKKLPFVTGLLAYILGVLFTLISYGKNMVSISIDGKTMEVNTLLIAVANGKYYGGGMQPAPSADIYDGILDICLIRSVGRLRILKFFPKFIKGQHEHVKEVSLHKGREIKITSHKKVALNIDGEVSIVNGETLFQIIPGAIKIVIPKTEVRSEL